MDTKAAPWPAQHAQRPIVDPRMPLKSAGQYSAASASTSFFRRPTRRPGTREASSRRSRTARLPPLSSSFSPENGEAANARPQPIGSRRAAPPPLSRQAGLAKVPGHPPPRRGRPSLASLDRRVLRGRSALHAPPATCGEGPPGAPRLAHLAADAGSVRAESPPADVLLLPRAKSKSESSCSSPRDLAAA